MLNLTKIQAEIVVGKYDGENVAPFNSVLLDPLFYKITNQAARQAALDDSNEYSVDISYLPDKTQIEILSKII